MIKSATFAVLAIFWVVMNSLLWRAEFGSGHDLASRVPVSLVWEKIITAPDDSSLGVNMAGKKLGYIRIRPVQTEVGAERTIVNENEPEGMVRKLKEYLLQIEGSLVMEALGRSARFESHFAYDTSYAWKRMELNTSMRPDRWTIKANAASREFWFQSTDGDSEWIHRFEFDDLRNPQKLATIIDSPLLTMLLPQYLGAAAATNTTTAPLSLGLKWEARYEWLRIGRNRVRIYRLEAKLLDRHSIVVLVSRVGEILRIELPGDLKLINDVLYAS